MVTAVLFDFGQTLVDSSQGFRVAEKEAETEIFKDLSLESWPEFLSDYRDFRQDFHARSLFSRKALWQAIYEHYNRKPQPDLLSRLEHEYWETVKARTRPFPETRAVLERLTSCYRLALITNTQGQEPAHKHRLALFSELETLFEVIVVAGEGGVPPKPDPEPFLSCLAALGVEPGESVYVGDDWRIDVCGSKRLGIQPIWLQHHSVSRKWPQVETAVPVISSLEALLDLERLGIQ